MKMSNVSSTLKMVYFACPKQTNNLWIKSCTIANQCIIILLKKKTTTNHHSIWFL